jgi:uncharacterized RDD family membrane protein YckC
MNCPKCHTELLNRAAFCSECGLAVGAFRPAAIYASFWQRVLAVFIDLGLFWVPLVFAAAALHILPIPPEESLNRTISIPIPDSHIIEQRIEFMLRFGIFMAFVEVCLAPYYIFLECSSWQATIGKRLLGLRVTDEHMRRISPGRSVLRYFGRNISTIPWLMGFLAPLITARKQALHDVIAGTFVLRGKAEPQPPFNPGR